MDALYPNPEAASPHSGARKHGRGPARTALLALAAASTLLMYHARGADRIPDADCLQCHGDSELSKTNAEGRTISLFVDEARFRVCTHATNGSAPRSHNTRAKAAGTNSTSTSTLS